MFYILSNEHNITKQYEFKWNFVVTFKSSFQYFVLGWLIIMVT